MRYRSSQSVGYWSMYSHRNFVVILDKIAFFSWGNRVQSPLKRRRYPHCRIDTNDVSVGWHERNGHDDRQKAPVSLPSVCSHVVARNVSENRLEPSSPWTLLYVPRTTVLYVDFEHQQCSYLSSFLCCGLYIRRFIPPQHLNWIAFLTIENVVDITYFQQGSLFPSSTRRWTKQSPFYSPSQRGFRAGSPSCPVPRIELPPGSARWRTKTRIHRLSLDGVFQSLPRRNRSTNCRATGDSHWESIACGISIVWISMIWFLFNFYGCQKQQTIDWLIVSLVPTKQLRLILEGNHRDRTRLS